MSAKRCRNYKEILIWSIYFSAIVFFIILHPEYTQPVQETLTEVQKVVISVIMFFIFNIMGLLTRLLECLRKKNL